MAASILTGLVSLAGVFLSAFVAASAIFLLWRALTPRHTPAFRDRLGRVIPGSIAELCAVAIHGCRQWLLIRGIDRAKPVLLFLHGGPGAAHIGVFRKYQRTLEKYFVVVQWDQRGAGLSGAGPLDDGTLSKEQFVRDGLAVTDHLRERFKAKRIWLVGHSWGTGLGYILAQRWPDRYHAYAGIAHMPADNLGRRNWEAILGKARELGEAEAVRELEALGPPPYKAIPGSRGLLHKVEEGNQRFAGMLTVFKWCQHFGGDAVGLDMTRVFIRDLLFSQEYRLGDAIAWIDRKGHLANRTFIECNEELDLKSEGLSFDIPVFFLLGRHDLQTYYRAGEELFEAITAPQKRLFWFDAAHHIPWECTDEYQRVLVDAFTEIAGGRL